ncbi:DUF6263 family protein [Aureivirga sp. CE67]|uniref:DUF6263 family protein n=1 Tax=Aureivirga sp. CE67 TaxID=1788983 RepID=UPI0018CBA4D4|nr:DUF6263 family protein [Aureivirga sp. CE67]
MRKFILFIIISIFTFQVNAQRVSLELNLEKGKIYYQKSVNTTEVDQKVQGMDINVKVKTSSTIGFKVMDLKNDKYLMNCEYVSIISEIEAPQGKKTVDSENLVPNDPTSKFYNLLKNEEFQIEISKHGRIISVKNLNGLVDRIFKKGEFSEFDRNTLKQSFDENFGEEQIKSNMELNLKIYPESKVKVGDTWERNITQVSNTEIGMQNSYEFISSSKTENKIGVKGTLKSDANGSFFLSNGVYVKPQIEGNYDATIILDAKTGWIKKLTSTQHLKGETKVKYTQEGEVAMEIPLIILTSIEITD